MVEIVRFKPKLKLEAKTTPDASASERERIRIKNIGVKAFNVAVTRGKTFTAQREAQERAVRAENQRQAEARRQVEIARQAEAVRKAKQLEESRARERARQEAVKLKQRIFERAIRLRKQQVQRRIQQRINRERLININRRLGILQRKTPQARTMGQNILIRNLQKAREILRRPIPIIKFERPTAPPKDQPIKRGLTKTETKEGKKLRVAQIIVNDIINTSPQTRETFKFLTKGEFKFKKNESERRKQVDALPISQFEKDRLIRATNLQEKGLDSLAKFVKGAVEGVKEDPEIAALTTVASFFLPPALAALGGLKVVKKLVKFIPPKQRAKGAAFISKGLTTAYVVSTGLIIAATEKGKRIEKTGRIFSTEVLPFKIGTRFGVQGLLRKEVKKEIDTAVNKLPKNKQEAFKDYMKQAEVLSKYEPEARNIKLNNIESIPNTKAQNIIRKFLKDSKGNVIVGGSVAQTSQVNVKRKLGDMDLYLEQGGIGNAAKRLANKLREAGVKRVSSIRGQVTIGGKKAIEFHNVDRVLTNIEQVIPSWQNARRYLITTPEGIKIQRIGLQARRKIIAAFADERRFATGKYKKDLKDFKNIANEIFNKAELNARNTFFFKQRKIKGIKKIFKGIKVTPKPTPKKPGKPKPVKITDKKPKKPGKPKPVKITDKKPKKPTPKPKKPSKPTRPKPRPSQPPRKPPRIPRPSQPPRKPPKKPRPSQPPRKPPKKPEKPTPPSQLPPKRSRKPTLIPPIRRPEKPSPPSQPPVRPPRKPPKKPPKRPPRRPPRKPPKKPPKRPPRRPPRKPSKKRIKEIKKKQPGFNVIAKPLKTLAGKKPKRGLRINKVPLTQVRADDLRQFITDTSLARTARTVPTKAKAQKPKLKFPRGFAKKSKFKFRTYRIRKGKRVPLKRGKVIERGEKGRNFLLDTIQEKRGINLRKRLKQISKPKRKITPKQRKILIKRLEKARRVKRRLNK